MILLMRKLYNTCSVDLCVVVRYLTGKMASDVASRSTSVGLSFPGPRLISWPLEQTWSMVTGIVLAATPLYQHITRYVHPIFPALTKPLKGPADDGSSITLYVFKCMNDVDVHNRPQTSVQGGLSGLILAWANVRSHTRSQLDLGS